jgi:hypothetical protein
LGLNATAITANNCPHKKFFDNTKNYDGFYEFVCRIMHCSFALMGEGLQGLLVDWLCIVQAGRAADWEGMWRTSATFTQLFSTAPRKVPTSPVALNPLTGLIDVASKVWT